jgi:hypothetical protein
MITIDNMSDICGPVQELIRCVMLNEATRTYDGPRAVASADDLSSLVRYESNFDSDNDWVDDRTQYETHQCTIVIHNQPENLVWFEHMATAILDANKRSKNIRLERITILRIHSNSKFEVSFFYIHRNKVDE